MVDMFEKSRTIRKILILVEILKNLDFFSKFAKTFDFGWNFRKFSILVEIFQKSRFCRLFLIIANLVDIFEKSSF